jgi:hypothetical protein
MMELGEGLCKLRKLQLDGDGDNDGGGPFSRFRDEIAAVLQFLYRTQKELAACTYIHRLPSLRSFLLPRRRRVTC